MINLVKNRIVLVLEHDHSDKNKPETTKIKKFLLKLGRPQSVSGMRFLQIGRLWTEGVEGGGGVKKLALFSGRQMDDLLT